MPSIVRWECPSLAGGDTGAEAAARLGSVLNHPRGVAGYALSLDDGF